MNSSALVRKEDFATPELLQTPFDECVHTLNGISLSYRLFIPERVDEEPAPLLLMLHGCGQNAQDFSIGTQMDAIAQEAGMYVLYPNQSTSANPNGCWNWFVPQHQVRDGGEPAALCSLTQEVMNKHPIDTGKVFVAGLSAGGAMAVILAEQYPEVFAAAGVHSGLPSGAASTMMEAFNQMRRPRVPGSVRNAAWDSPNADVVLEPRAGGNSSLTESRSAVERHTPLIVFHGNKDRTVNCDNAALIVDNWLARESAKLGSATWRASSTTHASPCGRRSVVTTFAAKNSHKRARCEYWQLIDAGHQWSGGCTEGSCTDSAGPNASAEMVRFFMGSV